MADGSHQTALHLPLIGASRLRPGEIVVDLFAGGGGASEALRQALGRDPDIAINHDANAIGMHAANHPYTTHHCEDVWHANPVAEVAGRRVGWLHASPDCTHFSQAKGGQPRDRATRSLSWVALKWLGMLLRAGNPPRIFSLENVRQILQWGPLVAKRDTATGRVMRRTWDGWAVAAPGERVPVRDQWLIPDKRHAGRTWRTFVAALRGMGYAVEWKRMVASDYGAGTSRERLFLVARRDGAPIVWPAPTHGRKPGLLPPVAAADCIDWTLPCRSIFNRPRPLADKTMRRIARGVHRFVLTAAEPFIVGVGGRMGDSLERGISGPMQTITAKADAAVCVPHLVKMRGDSGGAPVDEPMPTITTGGAGARPQLVEPLLMGVGSSNAAKPVSEPMPTITTGGASAENRPGNARPQLLEPLIVMRTNSAGGRTSRPIDEPMPTICTAGGGFLAEPLIVPMSNSSATGTPRGVDEPIRTVTTAKGGDQALAVPLVAPYYGSGSGLSATSVSEPVPSVTTKARFGLAEPVLMRAGHGDSDGRDPGSRVLDPDAPLPALTTSNEVAVAQPRVAVVHVLPSDVADSAHGIATPDGISDSGRLPDSARHATGSGSHVQGSGTSGDDGLVPAAAEVAIDVNYRMLHWRELARATSFDDEGHIYDFAGNATQITKQIGNAVPGRTAKALVSALMAGARG